MPDTSSLVADVVAKVADEVRPLLSDREQLRRGARVTIDKGQGHYAHQIDNIAEKILLDQLRSRGYRGSVFSEEAGLVRLGTGPEMLVSDPYCNTSLTFRGIRESAVTLYHFDQAGIFLEGAIADLQIPRQILISPVQRSIQWTDGFIVEAKRSVVERLEDAFVAVSLLKPSRRGKASQTLFRRCGNLTSIDGGIVALRLCVGEFDAFVDAVIGQPAYEALAYQLFQQGGGIVSDHLGHPIDWTSIIEELEGGFARRQTVVAAATASLHSEILHALAS